MFGRVINKIFKRGTPTAKPGPSPEPAKVDSPFGRTNTPKTVQPEPPAPTQSKPPTPPAKPDKAAERVKKQWADQAGKKLNAKDSPEVLCGINQNMSPEEIAEKLATLYRRHNRAASSLDPQMREEAEIMLEAIATAKEKYLPKR